MKSIRFRIGFCGVAVTLVFLRPFLSSYNNLEVNTTYEKDNCNAACPLWLSLKNA